MHWFKSLFLGAGVSYHLIASCTCGNYAGRSALSNDSLSWTRKFLRAWNSRGIKEDLYCLRFTLLSIWVSFILYCTMFLLHNKPSSENAPWLCWTWPRKTNILATWAQSGRPLQRTSSTSVLLSLPDWIHSYANKGFSASPRFSTLMCAAIIVD